MEKPKVNVVVKILHFIYRDLVWKVLALGLAFMLWFVGINVNNPIQNVIYDNIPITILNRDRLNQNNVVLLNEQQVTDARISLSVRATRNDHALINAARNDNIQASLDLNTINLDHVLNYDGVSTVSVDVNVFVHQEHSTIFPHPSTIELELDLHEERIIAINVDVVGEPTDGFEVRPFSATPRIVRLTGARSVLQSISDVRAQISVNDAFETVEEPRPLIVFNNDLQNITSLVGLNVQSTNVIVPVFPYEYTPLTVNTVGTTAVGFMVTEINISPAAIDLVGSPEELDRVSSLILGEIDLTGLNDTVQYDFDIRDALSGTNLTLRTGEVQEATVDVIVEEIISRTFYMPLANLEQVGEEREFEFVNDNPIVLTLHGRASAINALSLNNIQAILDLTGFGAGTHTVQLQITVPPRVSLANLAAVQITIPPEEIIFEPEEPPDFFADGNGITEDEETDPTATTATPAPNEEGYTNGYGEYAESAYNYNSLADYLVDEMD
ncbi:MAG: CdaR family protein [Defluviitaleaceae bacterium]|nr:CdaR family protein [Defluviitaleaceae bacterium]